MGAGLNAIAVPPTSGFDWIGPSPSFMPANILVVFYAGGSAPTAGFESLGFYSGGFVGFELGCAPQRSPDDGWLEPSFFVPNRSIAGLLLDELAVYVGFSAGLDDSAVGAFSAGLPNNEPDVIVVGWSFRSPSHPPPAGFVSPEGFSSGFFWICETCGFSLMG